MSQIGDKILGKVQEEIKEMFNENTTDINDAFIKMGDADLTVSISVKFSIDDRGVKYNAKMTFPSGAKVESYRDGIVDENQMDLEFPKDDVIANQDELEETEE